jgi:hypothetical protein
MVFLLESDLLLLAVIVFLFALSYLAPLFYNVKGILYREIFGVVCHVNSENELLTEQNSAKKDYTNDDSFSA